MSLELSREEVADLDLRYGGCFRVQVKAAMSGPRALDLVAAGREEDRSSIQMLELLQTEFLKHKSPTPPSRLTV